MKTIKLYDQDAFLGEFDAEVLSCAPRGKGFAVCLNQTAFFPQGGGQPADAGMLGGEPVLDVFEENGTIFHLLAKPISGTVHGAIDREKRFSRMQNHSGEHVLSGVIHRLTGADNISFSLTDRETTLAFNKPLSGEMLEQAERIANEAVAADAKITAYYPDAQELARLEYRSKLELTENVRIVEIEGVDRCACCAPHCRSTGQIGLIKIIDSEPYKGGTKLWIVCGTRALEHHAMLLAQCRAISHLLCAKTDAVAPAVEKLKRAKESAEYALVSLKRKAISDAVAATKETDGNYLVVSDFEGDDLRLFADGLKEKIGGLIIVLSGSDDAGYRYVITAAQKDIGDTLKAANRALNGRGGGRDNMARGSFGADLKTIKAFFDLQ